MFDFQLQQSLRIEALRLSGGRLRQLLRQYGCRFLFRDTVRTGQQIGDLFRFHACWGEIEVEICSGSVPKILIRIDQERLSNGLLGPTIWHTAALEWELGGTDRDGQELASFGSCPRCFDERFEHVLSKVC